MGKVSEKIFVLIKMFKGLYDGVELFWDENEAERAYKEYTGYDYPKNNKGFEDIPEKFSDCRIFEAEVPLQEHTLTSPRG